MILLGFLAAVLVSTLDPLLLPPALALGVWQPRGSPLLAVMLLAAALRFALAVVIRSEQAAQAPELFVLGIAAAAAAGACGVLLGAGLRHLVEWWRRR